MWRGAPARAFLRVPRLGTRRNLTPGAARKLARSADVFLFDMDGVVWSGGSLIGGAREALQALRSVGKRVVFVTNNSMKRRAEMAADLRRLGVDWAEERHVFNSGAAAAALLEARGVPKDRGIYVLGEEGLVAELQARGYGSRGGPDDAGRTIEELPEALSRLSGSGPASSGVGKMGAVVVGNDRQMNFFKLAVASHLIRNGMPLIAANDDLFGPQGPVPGQMWPGAGSILAAVAAGAGRSPPTPDVLAGKPSLSFSDAIRRELGGVPARRMVMVGDRLDTDIAFGVRAGMRTLLVLSGVTDFQAALHARGELVPDYTAPSIAALRDVAEE